MTIDDLIRARVVASMGRLARKGLAWLAGSLVAAGSALVVWSLRRKG